MRGIVKVGRQTSGHGASSSTIQITIPKEVVNEVGLKPGDRVMVSTDDSNGEMKITITKEK